MAWRGRHTWGNCDKGRRLANGRWELWPPENPEYHDPARWAEIRGATKTFGEGYEAAKAEPWLFTHKVGDNTLIVFNAFERGGVPLDNTTATNIVSL